MSPAPTPLPDVLRERARCQPDDRAFVFLDEYGQEARTLTYGELDARARAVAAALADLAAAPGERALLVFETGPDFLAAYLGCLYAGVVAVPVVPPRAGHVRAGTLAIARDCAPVALLGEAALLDVVAPALAQACPGLRRLAVDQLGTVSPLEVETPQPDALAFLQYTSGSTAAPKGVMVTHGNLTANLAMLTRAFRHDPDSPWVGWTPLFHDQGLIANALHPLYLGALGVLMTPSTFIRRPMLWLRAISRYRAQTSGGPNFAFDLCVTHATRRPAGSRTGLDPAEVDLRCWTNAFNGAEPLRAGTLRRFAETFAPYGLRPQALWPCYGLAEATLIVTGSEPGRGPRTLAADPDALAAGQCVASTRADAHVLIGSGQVPPDSEIRIMDPETGLPRPAGGIGEIWVAGPHVTAGYWRRPEATAAAFVRTGSAALERRYLRTGDLGLIVDGELYVAGRLRDLIIIRGRNHFPQDIEFTVTTAHAAARPNGVAAFTVPGAGSDSRLVVVLEVRATPGVDLDEVAGAIRATVLREHDLAIGEVVLTRPGALPTTSSGKIMRAAARNRYLNAELPAPRHRSAPATATNAATTGQTIS
ncbi:AMP-dependent synthetase and ligase [Frankia sp. AiPs1]|uniref:fatty acyl-AMP ligase n=1 Tax=Frankia sp. AiPa1 TaxID=573492 RepID=UPI00202AE2CF|nr:fatty acyl-AMP ligase [Frankia sp. AiPa1]MCL9758932.1 fatty acyl-AMP ligase [Frankia sp. AiPa1]